MLRRNMDEIQIKVEEDDDHAESKELLETYFRNHLNLHHQLSTISQLQPPPPCIVTRSISYDAALTAAPTYLMQFKKELGIHGVQRKRSYLSHHTYNGSSVSSRSHSPLYQGNSPNESIGGTPSALQMPDPVSHIRSRLQNLDARRWSLSSLPTSGYETPGSSIFSSRHSSQEQLPDQAASSNDPNPRLLDDIRISLTLPPPKVRLRSRSLSSGSGSVKPTGELEITTRNNIYKERFPKAKSQMETNLDKFISVHSRLLSNQFESSDVEFAQILSDGSARFVFNQILELASDCLSKSKDNLITSAYFFDLSQNLEELLQEVKDKSPNSLSQLTMLARRLLLIVSRPARLLECLEFDPEEFYRLLEEAECRAREMQSNEISLPQYILQKLGLAKEETSKDVGDEEMDIPNIVEQDKDEFKTAAEQIRGRPPKEDDFEPIKLISNGAYGTIHLVKHIESGQRFALKKLKKLNLALHNQVDQVYAERDILTFTDNPFVVSFYGSFETKKHLCMVLEYVKGGDCAALLKNIGMFPVEMALLYIAETVLAIEYLHSYGIVHRDLKPDNLLITAFGHIKLTDFGLSKIGLMNRTNMVYEVSLDYLETHQFQDRQICGTPEYIAPEVILRLGYGKPVDWWAVGVILYEFLVGVVPFLGDSPEDLFSHIISDEIMWPDEPEAIPAEAQNLISNLLQKNPLDRLGTMNGAFDIKQHPFFSNLNWDSMLRQKAEFVPNLMNEDDTSYFDVRSDRYCHDAESDKEDVDNSPMFSSFSSYSPKFDFLSEESPHLPNPKKSSFDERTLNNSDAQLKQAVRTRQLSEPRPNCMTQISFPSQETTNISVSDNRGRCNSGTDTNANTNFLSLESISLFNSLKPPMVIKRGPKGFGLTINAIRVYTGQSSQFTIQHLVTDVDCHSPAFEAGLRADDLVTHVNGESIQNMTHTEVVQRMLGGGSTLTLKVCPLLETSIRKGKTKKSPSVLLRRKFNKHRSPQGSTKNKSSKHRFVPGKRPPHVTKANSDSADANLMFHRSFSTSDSVSSNDSCFEKNSLLSNRLTSLRKRFVSGIRADSSSSSSPMSSISDSPLIDVLQARPSSLHGLSNQKASKHPISSNRRHSTTLVNPAPLSPLVKLTSSGDCIGAKISPSATKSSSGLVNLFGYRVSRSPSPLAVGCDEIVVPPTDGRRNSVTIIRRTVQPKQPKLEDHRDSSF